MNDGTVMLIGRDGILQGSAGTISLSTTSSGLHSKTLGSNMQDLLRQRAAVDEAPN
jgi:hypothetical protein